ncbi:MAG: zf-HC2 domain-containing protein [Betaproteobacteria bacterium]|nr:MAG: zf-HC2 domain-containing protein [Betaproteobacteria bacterium]
MTNKPIDCEKALNILYDYLDRELGVHDHEAMEHHLSVCKSCFSRVEFEQRLKDKMKSLREERPATGSSERIKQLLKDL